MNGHFGLQGIPDTSDACLQPLPGPGRSVVQAEMFDTNGDYPVSDALTAHAIWYRCDRIDDQSVMVMHVKMTPEIAKWLLVSSGLTTLEMLSAARPSIRACP